MAVHDGRAPGLPHGALGLDELVDLHVAAVVEHLDEQPVLGPVQGAHGGDGLVVALALVAHGHLHQHHGVVAAAPLHVILVLALGNGLDVEELDVEEAQEKNDAVGGLDEEQPDARVGRPLEIRRNVNGAEGDPVLVEDVEERREVLHQRSDVGRRVVELELPLQLGRVGSCLEGEQRDGEDAEEAQRHQ